MRGKAIFLGEPTTYYTADRLGIGSPKVTLEAAVAYSLLGSQGITKPIENKQWEQDTRRGHKILQRSYGDLASNNK